MNHRPSNGNSRPRSARTLCLLGATILVVFGIASCQTPPSVPQIHDTFDDLLDASTKAYHLKLQACAAQGNPPGCVEGALNWYQQRLSELDEGRQEAIEESWEDAREEYKKWQDEFREAFPDWPEINEILKNAPWLLEAEVSYDLELDATGGTDPCEEVVNMVEAFRNDWATIDLRYDEELLEMVNTSPCFRAVTMPSGAIFAQAQEGDTWSMTGTVASKVGTTTTTGSITGSLGLVESWSETPGNTRWAVVSGQLYLNLGNTTILQLSVLDEVTNGIEVNSSGVGSLKALFGNHFTNDGWNAILPYYNRIELPVTVGSGGEIVIDSGGWIDPSELAPHTPWRASDYNDNDVLDYATDYAAFSTAHGNEELLADQDVDGDWDQDDIDLWTERFWIDYAAQ